MPSPRLSSTLAVRFFSGLMLSALAGCCCTPVCETGDGHLSGGHGHAGHGRVLRRGTLSPPVPEPAVASPIPRYHPLPTHPVFEPQPDYLPLTPLDHDSKPLAPGKLPQSIGEPTPAPLPPEPAK